MTMVTGTPAGTICSQDDIYLEGSPYLYFQDYRAKPLFNPDADGYYYGLSGTAVYCVYNLGCINDVSLTEDVTVNNIRCDTVGDKDVVQRRNYVEFVFTLQTMFPLVQLRHLLGLSVPTVSGGIEKVGIGSINNNPLTIAGITNKQIMNGYTEFMFKPVENSCYFKEKMPSIE